MTKDRPSGERPASEIILYQTEDGTTRLSVRLEGETVWLTQAAMAELFQTTPQNITIHVKSIYEDGELEAEATCKDYLQVRSEGTRQAERRLKHYNLDMVIAVGYRFGYTVSFALVGPVDGKVGSPTRMGVFRARSMPTITLD